VYPSRYVFYYIAADHPATQDEFPFTLATSCWKDDFIIKAIIELIQPAPPVQSGVLGQNPHTEIDLHWKHEEPKNVFIHLWYKEEGQKGFTLVTDSEEPTMPPATWLSSRSALVPGSDPVALMKNLKECTTYLSYTRAYYVDDDEMIYPSMISNIHEITTGCDRIKLGEVCNVDGVDECDTNIIASIGEPAAEYLTCGSCNREDPFGAPAAEEARSLKSRRALASKRARGNKRGLLFAPIPTTSTTTTFPMVCRCAPAN